MKSISIGIILKFLFINLNLKIVILERERELYDRALTTLLIASRSRPVFFCITFIFHIHLVVSQKHIQNTFEISQVSSEKKL